MDGNGLTVPGEESNPLLPGASPLRGPSRSAMFVQELDDTRRG